jgi:hypothetical protein
MRNDTRVDSSSNVNAEEATAFKSNDFPAPIGNLLGLKLTQLGQ